MAKAGLIWLLGIPIPYCWTMWALLALGARKATMRSAYAEKNEQQSGKKQKKKTKTRKKKTKEKKKKKRPRRVLLGPDTDSQKVVFGPMRW